MIAVLPSPVVHRFLQLLLGIVALGLAQLHGQSTQAETHFFLVDVSASMWAKPKGAPATELEMRRNGLKLWLKSHQSSRVTLMSFDTDVHSPATCDLRNPGDRRQADEWVERLTMNKPRGTYLWSCVRKALETASNLAHQEPGLVVTLHVLTDRVDTERSSHRLQVMDEFRDAKWPADIAERKGDFEVTVQVPISPTPSVSPTPTSTASVPPTPTATPSPSPTPSPRLPEPGSPTPGPSHAPSSSPCVSPSPCSGKPLFETAEPHTVAHGQFAQFVNKTDPPAKAYHWTIQRSGTPVLDYENVAPRERSTETHWGYRFINRTTRAESYTVRLNALYGNTWLEAPPLIILVQRKPNEWTTSGPRVWHVLVELGSAVSGFVLFLTAVLALWKSWLAFNNSRKRARELRTLFEKFRNWLAGLSWTRIFICAVIAGMCLYASVSGERTAGNPAAVTAAASGPTAPSGIVIMRERPEASSLPAITLAALIGALITAALFFATGRGSRLKDFTSWIPIGRPTIRTQLEELKEFCGAGIVEGQQARSLRRELFERWREAAGLTKVPEDRPWLGDRLPDLVNNLVSATQNKSQTWAKSTIRRRGEPEHSGNTRFVTVNPPAKAENESQSTAQIEISVDGHGVEIAVLNNHGDVIACTDEEDAAIPPATATQLRKLYDLAKESAFEVRKTLDTIIAQLKSKPAAKDSGGV
jgi:hypothetical protein